MHGVHFGIKLAGGLRRLVISSRQPLPCEPYRPAFSLLSTSVDVPLNQVLRDIEMRLAASETRLAAAQKTLTTDLATEQAVSEFRLSAAQVVLKTDLAAAQMALKTELAAVQAAIKTVLAAAQMALKTDLTGKKPYTPPERILINAFVYVNLFFGWPLLLFPWLLPYGLLLALSDNRDTHKIIGK